MRSFDYSRRAEYIAELEARYRTKLEAQYAREQAAIASFESFAIYFREFVAAVPAALARGLGRIVFRITDPEGTKQFGIDIGAREVTAHLEPRSDDVVIDVPALILNDLVEKRMFSAWTPSKRLKIHVPGSSLRPVLTFLTLIDYFETGYLPLRSLLSLRVLGISTRRVREVAAVSEAALRYLYARHVSHVPLKPKMFFPVS